MIRENNEMRGALTVRLTDRQGQVVHHKRYKNHIVTSGRQLVAELFAGQAGGVPKTQVTHMAVGTEPLRPTPIPLCWQSVTHAKRLRTSTTRR